MGAIAGRLEAMTVDGRVVSHSCLSAEDGLAELRERLDGVTREIAAMPGIDADLGVQEDAELPPGVTVP